MISVFPYRTCFHGGLICLAFSVLLFSSCVDRQPTNPFDPDNAAPPPLTLKLRPDEKQVQLNWTLDESISDLQGFRLYRAVDSLSNPVALADFPATQRTFIDTVITAGKRYSYALTILGTTNESNRTRFIGTLPGPGKTLILNRNTFSLERVSYDLVHPLESIETSNFTPEDWLIRPQESTIWVLFAPFPSGISQISMLDGSRDETVLDTLQDAVDIAWRSGTGELYILDQRAAHIYTFSKGIINGGIALDDAQSYIRIAVDDAANRLFVLGVNELRIIDLTNNQTSALPFPAGFRGWDMEQRGRRLNVLTAASAQTASRLYMLENGAVSDSLQIGGVFYRLTSDSLSGGFYMAESFSGANDKVVKLSMLGERQLELPVGFLSIEQITINPFNQSVLVVDPARDRILLFDADGNLISEALDSNGRTYLNLPLRVHID